MHEVTLVYDIHLNMNRTFNRTKKITTLASDVVTSP